MTAYVNTLMLSDGVRAVLAEMSRRYDAAVVDLTMKFNAGKISEIELQFRVRALMTELRGLAAPVHAQIDAAIALAHSEIQGKKTCQ